MSNNSFKIKNSAVIVPKASPTLNEQGEVAYDNVADKLLVRGASTTDPVVQEGKTQDLTNKTIESSTIDADLNTITNIEDANIKAGAAIDAAKIADGTVSNAEFQYLNGVTSSIQTQLSSKVSGPGSSVDNTLPRFDGTTGAIIQGSAIVVDDANIMTGASRIEVDSLVLDGATLSSVSNPLVLAASAGSNLVLNATSGGVVDITGTLDVTGQADVDNINLNGNTISVSDTNGNLTLAGNGSGDVRVDNLALKTNTLSSTNTNGNILLDPNGTGVVSVEGAPLRLPEISTPATPASGYGNLYFKSDGFAYQQNDDGTETKIGAGSGGINYITNPDAESTATGWATYADTPAASRPIDGTGGSPTVTWTRSTSTPLRGVGSFLFTKDAANRQGEGVATDITISNADQARVLQISFDYQIASGTYSGGTSSTDSDLIVYVYRTTATGRLIEPSVIKLDGGVIGVNYSYRGEFQADSDATGYRIIVHVATTSTSAYTVKFDNVVVGPSKNVNGAIITQMQDATPTPAFTNLTLGNGAHSYKFARQGDKLIVQGSLTWGTTTSISGNVSLALPSGLSVDTAKISNSTRNPVGNLKAFDSSTGTVYNGSIRYNTTTTVSLHAFITVSASTYVDDAPINATTPVTWTTSDIFFYQFELPIAGWGAIATLGQDADTRVVALRSTKSTGNHTSTGNYQDVASYDVVDADTHGAFNSTTGIYTVPVSGLYQVSGSVGFALNATGARGVLVQKNGVDNLVGTLTPGNSVISSGLPFSGIIPCVAGDTLKVRAFQSSGGNLAYLSGNGTNLSIQRISGPSQVAATEIIAAKYNTSSTAIGTTATAVVFTNKIADTHNAFNTSTGVFTCPATGLYEISGCTTSNTSVSSSAANSLSTLYIQKNSSNDSLLGTHQYQVSGVALVPIIQGSCAIISCIAGDTIRLTQTRNANISAYSLGGATDNWISIKRVGGIG